MSNRIEFSRKTRRLALDHVKTAEEGGEATLENCMALCPPCHRAKTAVDIRRIRKADRIRDKHTGAWKPKSRPMLGSRKPPWKQTFNHGFVRRHS